MFSESYSSTFSFWTKWFLLFLATNLNLQYACNVTKQNPTYKTERGRQKQDAIPFLPTQNWYELLLAEDHCLSWVARAAVWAGGRADIARSGIEIWAISQRNEGKKKILSHTEEPLLKKRSQWFWEQSWLQALLIAGLTTKWDTTFPYVPQVFPKPTQ